MSEEGLWTIRLKKELFLFLVKLYQAFPNHMWHICMIKRALPLSCTKREILLANSLLKTDFIILEVTLHGLQTKNTVLVVGKGTLDNPSWWF